MSTSHLPPSASVQLAYDLRRTIRELKDRGLIVAAKWCVVSVTSMMGASLPLIMITHMPDLS